MKHPDVIQCQHYCWRLFIRKKIYYADGRGNSPGIGKHSLGTKNRQEAMNLLHELDHAIAVKFGKAAPKPTPASAPSIGDGWRIFLENRSRPQAMGGVSPSTLKRYNAVYDKHIQFCRQQKTITWDQVTKGELEAYGRHLHGRKYKAATLCLELNTIKTVVKFLISEKLLPESARLLVATRRSHESDTYCYSRTEVEAIVESCHANPGTRWMYPLLTVLATTGIRIGEAATLRWTDIDLAANTIQITDNRFSSRASLVGTPRTTKNSHSRRTPMNPACHKVLAEMAAARNPDGFAFHGPLGGRLKPDVARTVLRRDVLAPLDARFPTNQGDIGFRDGRLHSFRHYFVSECFRAGVTEGEIRDWIGHKDSRIIERYRHLRYEDSARRMAQLNLLKLPAVDSHDAAHLDPSSNAA